MPSSNVKYVWLELKIEILIHGTALGKKPIRVIIGDHNVRERSSRLDLGSDPLRPPDGVHHS